MGRQHTEQGLLVLGAGPPGLEEVTVLPDPAAAGCNRGFAFATFYNYAAAEAAKKKLEGVR